MVCFSSGHKRERKGFKLFGADNSDNFPLERDGRVCANALLLHRATENTARLGFTGDGEQGGEL